MPATTTPSGLIINDTVVGDGAVASAGDNVQVHYTGWLFFGGEKGKKFDSSKDRHAPFEFPLGAGHVATPDRSRQAVLAGIHVPQRFCWTVHADHGNHRTERLFTHDLHLLRAAAQHRGREPQAIGRSAGFDHGAALARILELAEDLVELGLERERSVAARTFGRAGSLQAATSVRQPRDQLLMNA